MGAFTSEVIRRHAPNCWFPLSHADALAAHPRLELRALCDVDPAALSRAATAHQGVRTYMDPLRMFEEERPRLIGIATRTAGRADLICAALDRGTQALHVEKPLCNSQKEWARLAPRLEGTDVFVTYGALRRHLGPYRLARELVDSGQYGALREVRVSMGSATLYWTHPHSVDLILFAAGERRVAGVQAKLTGVEAGANPCEVRSDPIVLAASIYFEGGVVGHITQGLGSDFVLSCVDAEIAVRADGRSLDVYAIPPGDIYPHAVPLDISDAPEGPTGTLAPVSELVSCLDGDRSAARANGVVKRDLLQGQQVLFAMLQSHIEGSRVVELGTVDNRLVIHACTGGRYA